MSTDIVKTYMVVTGHNEEKNKEPGAVFKDIKLPQDFVFSTNRRFITVMPPRMCYGDTTRKMVPNEYIMHCSFIYRDPYHEKACMPTNMGLRSKYKKYEYKANYDTFDIIFTHNQMSEYHMVWNMSEKSDEELEKKIGDYLDSVVIDPVKVTEIMLNIKNHINDWKAQGIIKDADVTPQREVIVPTFNGFGLGGYRTVATIPPFTKDTKYKNIDIWTYAYTLEAKEYLTIKHDEPEQKDNTKNGIYSPYTKTWYHEEALEYYTRYDGASYKLYEDNKPWSYYAEFLLQY